MTSRVALVTGGNQGIGYAIVKALAAKQIRVLLGSRDLQKGQKAADEINQAQSNEYPVEAIQLDIDSDESVKQAAQTIQQKYRQIQILVNNAGIAKKGDAFDEEVARWTIATNYYGLKRMQNAFQPLLASNARVVNVSSSSGQMALQKMDQSMREMFLKEELSVDELDSLMEQFIKDVKDGTWEKNWPKSAYGVSKAGVTILTRIYGRDNAANGVIYSSCCPGYVSTSMSSYKGHKTIEEGASTPVYLTQLPDGSPNGKFWRDEQVQPFA